MYQTRYATEVLGFALVGMACLGSCGNPEPLSVAQESDCLYYARDDSSKGVQWACLFESPIVLAGTVVEVQQRDVPGAKGPLGFPMAQVKLIIAVGTVLQGRVTGPRVEVTGYQVRTRGKQPWKMNPPASEFERRQERLFFLREAQGRVRLVRDVFDDSLPLYGGTRLPAKFTALDPRTQGAALLLLPPKQENARRWRLHALGLITQAEHILGAEALDRFLYAARIVEDMPSEFAATFQENVNAFRLYYPQMKVRSRVPMDGCAQYGPDSTCRPLKDGFNEP